MTTLQLATLLLTADLLALLACAVRLHVTMRAGAIADLGAFCNSVEPYCNPCNNERTIADYATVDAITEAWDVRYSYSGGGITYVKREQATRRRAA